MLGSRVARTWRGVSAAVVATLVAAASHSIADGAPAPVIGVVLALVVAVPLCVALAGRRLSWLRLGIAVTASQFALHGLMLLGVSDPGGSVVATGHVHDAAGVAAALAGTAAPAHVMHSGATMWIAHAIAALITVLAIGRGEAALRALLALSGWTLAARLADWRPLPVAPRTPRPVTAPRVLRSELAPSVVRRRGPPLAV